VHTRYINFFHVNGEPLKLSFVVDKLATPENKTRGLPPRKRVKKRYNFIPSVAQSIVFS